MNDFEKYWEESASKESWANKAVAWNIWKEKQAIIDDLRSQLNNMEACYIEKKKEVEGVHDRIDGALFEMRQLSLILSKDIDGYEDPAQICQSEGVDMGVKILEKALRGES